MKNSEESQENVCDTIKSNNIHIMGIPEEKEKRIEGRFKAVMAKNFPNLCREMDIQKHEAQKTPYRMNNIGWYHHTL